MSNELENKIERLEQLKQVGFRKLRGEERTEYQVLIKELEGVDLEEESTELTEGESLIKEKKTKDNVLVIHSLDRNVRFQGKLWKRGEEFTADSENFELFNSLGFLELKIKK